MRGAATRKSAATSLPGFVPYVNRFVCERCGPHYPAKTLSVRPYLICANCWKAPVPNEVMR